MLWSEHAPSLLPVVLAEPVRPLPWEGRIVADGSRAAWGPLSPVALPVAVSDSHSREAPPPCFGKKAQWV